MVKIKHADSTHLATVSTLVGNSAHAYSMVLAVRNTAGEQISLQNPTFSLILCIQAFRICCVIPSVIRLKRIVLPDESE